MSYDTHVQQCIASTNSNAEGAERHRTSAITHWPRWPSCQALRDIDPSPNVPSGMGIHTLRTHLCWISMSKRLLWSAECVSWRNCVPANFAHHPSNGMHLVPGKHIRSHLPSNRLSCSYDSPALAFEPPAPLALPLPSLRIASVHALLPARWILLPAAAVGRTCCFV